MKKCMFCEQELINEAGQCGRCGKIQSLAAQSNAEPEADRELIEELERMRRILSLSK